MFSTNALVWFLVFFAKRFNARAVNLEVAIDGKEERIRQLQQSITKNKAEQERADRIASKLQELVK